jgi:hypothetical protein
MSEYQTSVFVNGWTNKSGRGMEQGEDHATLKAQIIAYINYMEAMCTHAHYATDFLVSSHAQGIKNMVSDDNVESYGS